MADTHPYAQFHLLALDVHLMYLYTAYIHRMSAQSRANRRWRNNDNVREGEGETHPEVDTNCRTALVLWEPLLVRKAKEQTALPDGRVPDEEELDVDGCGCLVLILCVRHGVCWRGLGGARCESCRVVKCTGSRP